MEILAYHKRKPSWSLTFDSKGQIQTGMQGWTSGSHEVDVPIFKAKLKYHGHYQGTKSVMIQFKGEDMDSFVAILAGTGPIVYDMDREEGMETMEHLILQDDPDLEYHGNGWFTGIFTFCKRGRRVFLTRYRKDWTKERPV